MNKNTEKTNEKTIEERYTKKELHEHILTIPDTYLGTTKVSNIPLYVFNDELNRITHETKQIVLGLYKIFDEILVNSADNTVRNTECNEIKINIDKETGIIAIQNNGNTIPVAMHKEFNVYVPELIFGSLLSSSNFEEKGKIVGGKNGYGAKIANIYSTSFMIEMVDSERKLKFIQHYSNNMYTKTEPIITKCKEQSYVKITFHPDYERFGLSNLTDDMISLFKRRIYDIAGTTNERVKVFYNDELIKIKTFEDYIKMYYENDVKIIYEKVNDRWSVGIVYDNNTEYRHISFVNNISTFQGGTHVKYLTEQIVSNITNKITSKYKTLKIKPSIIKDNMTIFVNSLIEDPSFNSQIKEKLETKVNEYEKGKKEPCILSDKFISDMCKTGLLDEIINTAKAKEMATLNKSDGTKKNNLKNLVKLVDAKYAGTKQSHKCTLIVTEGDSAKTHAINGLSEIGNEYYGVFPLKGKMLNVREATIKQLLENEEIKNIKQIMGLVQTCKYETEKEYNSLRYGHILFLTDQDFDGFHIKGLGMNFIHYFWPNLLKIDGFIQSLATPIVKAFKKNDKKKSSGIIFYSLSDYNEWLNNNDSHGYHFKYYKGLGTSTNEEAKEAYLNFNEQIIKYVWDVNKRQLIKSNSTDIINNEDNETNTSVNTSSNDSVSKNGKTNEKPKKTKKSKMDVNETNELSDQAIILAFAKSKADERKLWLKTHNPNSTINASVKKITFDDFINKDLIQFSNADNIRSIPNIYDGFKPSQRKVIYGAFKRNLYSEIKVAQLSGYISEHAGYHHGEVSLQGTIINMAQNFIGSNNINLFNPNGNFGTREKGGKDSASPRYIFTELSNLTKSIFIKEDEHILIYKNEDGDLVEPETYYPIIPMILVNGTEGIGTGYSTNIPLFNPLDIVENLKRYLNGKKQKELIPWYRGFTGKIEKNEKGIFECLGNATIKNENTIHITELPIGTWTNDYKIYLTQLSEDKIVDGVIVENKVIQDFIIEPNVYKIDITITFVNGVLQQLLKNDDIDKKLLLKTSINITNMHLFKDNIITKYSSPNDILIDFAIERLKIYGKRKDYIVGVLENEINIYTYKKKYIEEVCNDTITVFKKTEDYIIEELIKKKYPKLSHSIGENVSYDYLTDIKLTACTSTQIEKLSNLINNKQNELFEYKNKTLSEIWIDELDKFIEHYEKYMIEFNNIINNTKKTKKVSTKSKK